MGRVFSMSFFQVDQSDPYDYARFEHYTFVRANHVININQQTQLIEITNGEHNNFAKYPIMPFIKYLVEDKSPRRMMTGTSLFLA